MLRGTIRHFSGAVALLLFSSSSADGLSPALLQSWEAAWERVIGNALSAYLQRAADSSLAGLADNEQDLALDELYETLYPAVSWQALGNTVIDNMMSNCGEDVLIRVTPFFTGETGSENPDEDLSQTYAKCAQSAIGVTMETVGTTIQSKYAEITAIHAKYGIEYP